MVEIAWILAGLTVFALSWIAVCLPRLASMPSAAHWKLPPVSHLSIETLADIPKLDPLVHRALSLVLTSRPGVGRKSKIGEALMLIEDAIDHSVRHVRMASSQSVLIGLLTTVSFFSLIFFRGTRSESASEILQHVAWVYICNGMCILAALLMLFYARSIRTRGREASDAAFQYLDQLVEEFADTIDPRLADALTAVSRQFGQAWQEVVRGQINEIKILTEQVTGASNALIKLGEALVQAKVGTVSTEIVLLENLNRRLDEMSLRLDDGMRLLAQPFLQGLPVLEGLEDVGSKLASAIPSLADGAAAMRTAAEQLNQTSSNLQAESKHTGLVLRQEAKEGSKQVQAAMSQAIESAFGAPAAGMKESLERMRTEIEELRKILGSVVEGDGRSPHSLRVSANGTSEEAGLNETVRELTELLREMRSQGTTEGVGVSRGWFRR